MKKLFIYLFVFCLIIASVLAVPTMTRNVASTVTGGQTFEVTYTTSGTSGNYGVLIEEDISGGCTPSHIATGFLGSIVSTFVDIAITAPASGSCTFTGNYQFADAVGTQPLVDFSDQTITISGSSQTSNGSDNNIWLYVGIVAVVIFIIWISTKK